MLKCRVPSPSLRDLNRGLRMFLAEEFADRLEYGTKLVESIEMSGDTRTDLQAVWQARKKPVKDDPNVVTIQIRLKRASSKDLKGSTVHGPAFLFSHGIMYHKTQEKSRGDGSARDFLVSMMKSGDDEYKKLLALQKSVKRFAKAHKSRYKNPLKPRTIARAQADADKYRDEGKTEKMYQKLVKVNPDQALSRIQAEVTARENQLLAGAYKPADIEARVVLTDDTVPYSIIGTGGHVTYAASCYTGYATNTQNVKRVTQMRGTDMAGTGYTALRKKMFELLKSDEYKSKTIRLVLVEE